MGCERVQNADTSKHAAIQSAAACAAASLAAAILAIGTIVMATPRAAQATQQFAAQTGLSCTQCHADMGTPSKLTDFGQAFQANGDKVPEKK